MQEAVLPSWYKEDMRMTAKEKMHSGALYLPMDEELFQEQMRCLDRLYDFNQTRPSELDRRAALLRELFA